jgi:hypothetical protein
MKRMIGRHPLGIWIGIFCMLFCLVIPGSNQILFLINQDPATYLRFQGNLQNSPYVVQRVIEQLQWGASVVSVFFVLPLFAAGLVGVLLRRCWGMVAGCAAAICWMFLFAVHAMQRYALIVHSGLGQWSDYFGVIAGSTVLILCPCLLLVLGLGTNVDRFAAPRPNNHVLRQKEDGLEPFFLEDFLICTGQVLLTIPQVWIRKRLSWNTHPEELTRKLAGDEIIEGAITVHRAITIHRPPEKVWPWIAQLGRGAAYYSWDFLDNRGHRHADYLLNVAEPRVGDWNKDLGSIYHVETGKELVWYDRPDFLGMKTELAMTFRLDPRDGDGTRLHFRLSVGLPQTRLRARIAFRVFLLMDQVMSTEMLRRLKLMLETYEDRLNKGETNRSMAPHQGTPWGAASESRAAATRRG